VLEAARLRTDHEGRERDGEDATPYPAQWNGVAFQSWATVRMPATVVVTPLSER